MTTNFLKKNIYSSIRFLFKINLFLVTLLPHIVFASNSGNSSVTTGAGRVNFPNPINKQSILEIVQAVLKFVTELGAVLSVLALVYSGFLFLLARGNPAMLDRAKATFMWTIVGAMIVLGAFVLSDIIQNTAKEFTG